MRMLIVNPIAGCGYALKVLEQVQSVLTARNLPFRVMRTEYPGFAENRRIQAIRETYDVQGYRRFSSHRPYITERVGSGDLSEHIWIIHNRSKEINRLNHRNIICHFVDGSIIGSLDSYY